MTAIAVHRRIHPILALILLILGLCFGCILTIYLPVRIARGERTPQRLFTALSFFPPNTIYPSDYEVVTPPRWAGPGTPLGIGDEEDAYATYSPMGKNFGYLNIIVFYESYWRFARERYQYQSIFLRDSEPPWQITFYSIRAQESVVVCNPKQYIDDFGDKFRSCHYLARYDEFIVDLWAGVGPEHLSYVEFESIVRAIDDHALGLLGAIPTPMP